MCFSTNESNLLKNLLSPFSWFIQNRSNKNQITSLSNHINLSFTVNTEDLQSNFHKNKLNKQQIILLRQMIILNNLIDFFYKLFQIKNVSIKNLLEKSKKKEINAQKGQRSSLNSVLSYQMDCVNIFQDDFENAECNEILESTEKLIYQTNSFDLIDNNNTISSGIYFAYSYNDSHFISTNYVIYLKTKDQI